MSDVNSKQIAIIVHDKFEQVELTSPKEELEARGASVRIAAPEAGGVQGLHKLDPGDKFEVDVALAEAAADDYDAIVIPGGVINSDYLRMDQDARRIVRGMDVSGKPIAAICHGIWLLISAGIVRDRRLTSYHTLQDDVRNGGGEWTDREIVVDGNLITSRNPRDLPAFNQALLEALGA